MTSLIGKHIVLGVTGSIAAYKSAILIRLLRQHGAVVRVVMTTNASQFITPLTLESLSQNPVYTGSYDFSPQQPMEHIELARWADLILIAPASANFIARYTAGFAEDLLTTLCLAADSTVAVTPAMNQQMWLNGATQENIAKLKTRGVMLIGPEIGEQACGETGPGRMLEPDKIIPLLIQAFVTQSLNGCRVLVTAGPTQEPIDPVRYISNHSSGTMGYAVADAAVEAGAAVQLVSGPVQLPTPERATLINVNTAKEMYNVVMQSVAEVDIFIAAAAVSDYRLQAIAKEKIKKTADEVTLKLVKNPDILAAVAALDSPPFTVGFAAETDQVIANAQHKLKTKKLNMIASNQVGHGRGFGAQPNSLTVCWGDEQQELPVLPKAKLARRLINLIADHYHASH